LLPGGCYKLQLDNIFKYIKLQLKANRKILPNPLSVKKIEQVTGHVKSMQTACHLISSG
jgi:hypothetical protein